MSDWRKSEKKNGRTGEIEVGAEENDEEMRLKHEELVRGCKKTN